MQQQNLEVAKHRQLQSMGYKQEAVVVEFNTVAHVHLEVILSKHGFQMLEDEFRAELCPSQDN